MAKKHSMKVSKRTRKPSGVDTLTLALYLMFFILVVFGAWYHKISWILYGFIPFFVAIWYEYIKRTYNFHY